MRLPLRTAVLTLLTLSLPMAQAFSDVPADSWYGPYIEELVAMGVIGGNPDGSFGPGNHMTRAELAKVAVELGTLSGTVTGHEPLKTAPFRDVDARAWYAPHILRAEAAGLMRGYTNKEGTPTGLFQPAGFVTRAEAIKVLLSATDVAMDGSTEDPFRDTASDAWYAPYISAAYRLKIAEGYKNSKGAATGTSGPADHVTRAQVSKMAVLALDPEAFSD